MIYNFWERFKKWLTQRELYVWYIKKMWNPPENSVQNIIKTYAENEEVVFIQIGANDGFKNDPVYPFIRAYDWRGVLAEPQQDVFNKKLKPTYAGNKNLQLINVAVGPKRQKRKLFKVAFSNARWATGLASFDRSNIEKHIDNGYIAKWAEREGVKLPSYRKDYITAKIVETITFDDLVEQCEIENVDAIFIDAEGFDFQILKSIDLKKYRPDLLLFEELHISDDERKALDERFQALGYRLKKENRDVLAYQHKVISPNFSQASIME